ncbi:MAG TPA: M67 family metallopeptidase [Terriglobia bacterium]|nr:M67 family metallopeptidase [Terriglobia bacterium]
MPLTLGKAQTEAIREHGSADYPNECCGILLGQANGARKEVKETVPLKNLRIDRARAQEILPLDAPERESERNRFLIDPLEQLRVEKGARARGLDVLGYYHSHPDHHARPSEYDRDHAWPWYSYVIVSVDRGVPKDLTSWVLSDDRARFCPEPIEELNT